MKLIITFAAVLAVAAAQFPGFGPLNIPRYVRPTIPPPPPPRPSPASISVSRVSNSDQNANIIRYENEIYPDGRYNYAYETDNGIAAQEEGVPRDFGGNPPVRPDVAQGSFAWTSPEGVPIAISYIADENGYQPSGDAIPTPHPIPEAILKALDYISRNPPQQKKK
ncbi:larval cuticle protein LCP-22-like [Manduca sexta]|uniref:larval cuticle protein LCP-22-like n=1 Tax=Manduca sexta TaxID=7130 RepID=UPI001890B5A6|nr:larval cuticle protein LCP-22-like [Manduca sexta]